MAITIVKWERNKRNVEVLQMVLQMKRFNVDQPERKINTKVSHNVETGRLNRPELCCSNGRRVYNVAETKWIQAGSGATNVPRLYSNNVDVEGQTGSEAEINVIEIRETFQTPVTRINTT